MAEHKFKKGEHIGHRGGHHKRGGAVSNHKLWVLLGARCVCYYISWTAGYVTALTCAPLLYQYSFFVLPALQPTSCHYKGDGLTHPMLITVFLWIFIPTVTRSLLTRLGPSCGLNWESCNLISSPEPKRPLSL